MSRKREKRQLTIREKLTLAVGLLALSSAGFGMGLYITADAVTDAVTDLITAGTVNAPGLYPIFLGVLLVMVTGWFLRFYARTAQGLIDGLIIAAHEKTLAIDDMTLTTWTPKPGSREV